MAKTFRATFKDGRKDIFIYLCILKHFLQPLLHLLEFTRLDAAVGQQHTPELPLSDSAVHRIVPLKLGREKERKTDQVLCGGNNIFSKGAHREMGNSKY